MEYYVFVKQWLSFVYMDNHLYVKTEKYKDITEEDVFMAYIVKYTDTDYMIQMEKGNHFITMHLLEDNVELSFFQRDTNNKHIHSTTRECFFQKVNYEIISNAYDIQENKEKIE